MLRSPFGSPVRLFYVRVRRWRQPRQLLWRLLGMDLWATNRMIVALFNLALRAGPVFFPAAAVPWSFSLIYLACPQWQPNESQTYVYHATKNYTAPTIVLVAYAAFAVEGNKRRPDQVDHPLFNCSLARWILTSASGSWTARSL